MKNTFKFSSRIDAGNLQRHILKEIATPVLTVHDFVKEAHVQQTSPLPERTNFNFF